MLASPQPEPKRPVAWEPLKAKKRPGRLADERHGTWEVFAEAMPHYPGLLRVRVQASAEFELQLIVNDRGELVSQNAIELDPA